jgi:hypothetical protein
LSGFHYHFDCRGDHRHHWPFDSWKDPQTAKQSGYNQHNNYDKIMSDLSIA